MDGRVRIVAITLTLLIAMASAAWARMNPVMLGGGVAVALAGCLCSGSQTFCWDITADDTTITNSGGCSVGDTTVTLNPQADIVSDPTGIAGGYVLSIPSSYDWAELSSSGIFSETAGTLQFDIYFLSMTSWKRIFVASGALNTDHLLISHLDPPDELYVEYRAGGATGINTTTPAANLATGIWYTITIKWRQGSTDPSLSITANSSTGTTNTDLSPTTWTNALTTLRWPDAIDREGGATFYIKNIRMWDAWQD